MKPFGNISIAGLPDEQALAKDPRFVMMGWEGVRDWRIGTHGGVDYWARAEEWVTKRKSGEVDPLQYRLGWEE